MLEELKVKFKYYFDKARDLVANTAYFPNPAIALGLAAYIIVTCGLLGVAVVAGVTIGLLVVLTLISMIKDSL